MVACSRRMACAQRQEASENEVPGLRKVSHSMPVQNGTLRLVADVRDISPTLIRILSNFE